VPALAIAATEGEGEMKLYTYYRSQASFRVRIALNLKGIAREDSFLHLERATNSPMRTERSIRRWWSQP
jgi:glutathione S-transferase